MKYRFLSAARVEFLESIVWLMEQAGVETGVDFTRSVHESLQLIRVNPQIFSRVHGNIRKLPLKKYSYNIFYEVLDDEVVIIAVAHMKQRPNYWSDRLEGQ